MIAALLAAAASAQTYAFPSVANHGDFYPTAYVDQGGETDWNCGSITYAGHRGSDFGCGSFPGMDAGRTISAAAEGVVTASHDGEFDRCTTGTCAGGGGWGNHVYVEHPDGKTTIYAHMKQWSVLVSVGDPVVCGQALGEVGSSGYSTGPHLHFEVRNPSNASEDPFDGPCSAPPSYWTSQGVHGGLPDAVCQDPAACEPTEALACGDVLQTDNDGAGSTNATWRYGCDDFVYTGPERTWTFTTAVDQPVVLRVTGLADDLDVHVLDDRACDGQGCVAASSNPDASDELVTFDAVAGVEYVVVVDGWEGAVSGYTLAVECDPDPGPAHSGEPVAPTADTAGTDPDPGGTDTGAGEETDAPPTGGEETLGGAEGGVIGSDEEGGCGCASGARGGLALGLLPALLVRARRRSR